MKFPIAVLDVEDYLKELRILMQAEDCIIFLDTNFFALYYSLYTDARKELSDWIKPLVEQARIKIPVWVLHEYTNRFIRDRTNDYFSPIKRLNTLQKEFTEIKAFLRKNTSEETFITDLDNVETKLKEIYNLTKQKNGNLETIHLELEALLGSCILKSNLEELTEKASAFGNGRYTHKVPPGFEDGNKELNGFGDLIIWYEIVNYCKEKNIRKAVFLTNDNKKDWMYAPSKVKGDNGKSIANKNSFKIIDPRLIHEFQLATNSEDIYIINFEILTGLLINDDGRSFYNLAKALQLSQPEREEINDDLDEFLPDEFFDPEPYDYDYDEWDDTIMEDEYSHHFDHEMPDWQEEVGLRPFTRSDLDYLLYGGTLHEIIENLQSYDWHAQNNAIDRLKQIDLNLFPMTFENRAKFYFLGKAIYQSACGGSFKSRDFIESLEYTVERYSEFVIVFLLIGMLREIYFDSKRQFRKYELKSTFAPEILKFQELPKAEKAFQFINSELEPYEDYLLALPNNSEELIQIEIVLQRRVMNNEPISIIVEMKSNGKNLIHEVPNRYIHRNIVEGNIQEIENEISEFFAVSRRKIFFIYSPYNPNEFDEYFILESNMSLGITPRTEEVTELE